MTCPLVSAQMNVLIMPSRTCDARGVWRDFRRLNQRLSFFPLDQGEIGTGIKLSMFGCLLRCSQASRDVSLQPPQDSVLTRCPNRLKLAPLHKRRSSGSTLSFPAPEAEPRQPPRKHSSTRFRPLHKHGGVCVCVLRDGLEYFQAVPFNLIINKRQLEKVKKKKND